MTNSKFCVRLHHNGIFLKTKYSGGKPIITKDVDLDYLSYTVLMEDVKEKLKYDEIGGIYVNKGKTGGWTLLTDDKDLFKYIAGIDSKNLDFYVDNIVGKGIEPLKQFQPHVIVRPRPTPVQVNKSSQKRNFVTLRDIQLEQQKKKNETEEKLMARKKVELFEPCTKTDDIYAQIEGDFGDEESTDWNDYILEDIPDEELRNRIQQPKISNYEEIRQRNIQQNSERLASLNLPTLVSNLGPTKHLDNCKRKVTSDESEDYFPDNDSAHDSDEDEVNIAPVISKRNKRVVAVHDKERGRTTRSRASVAAIFAKEGAGEPLVPPATKRSQSSKNEKLGSMAAFLAMREKQKRSQVEPETMLPETNDLSPTDTTSEPAKRTCRGPTKMDSVHTRKNEDRKEIKLNELCQPVDDYGNVVTEFSNFLGTIAREYVPLDYVSWRKVTDKNDLWEYVKKKYIIADEGKPWVLKTIADAWRTHKCRTKKKHYTCYDNDEERLKNRPKDVPLDEFKVLLKYWGDELVQKKAKKNSISRSNITDTHTAGPISFAQVSHTLKRKNPNHEPATQADLFVETRKRTEGRKYQSLNDVLKFRISKIEDIRSSGKDVETIDPLLSVDSHPPSWLIGRHVNAKKTKKSMKSVESDLPNNYIEDLTTKIRHQVTEEMEEKVNQKVRENMTWMINKLGEANPDLKLNIDEICAGQSGSGGTDANGSSED